MPADRGACEARLHPAVSDRLSPVAACSHGAAGTVQAVVLPDNLPPRDNIGGSNDPLVLHSQRPSE